MPNLPMPESLGTPNLECVMLDIKPLNVLSHMSEGAERELFFGATPELKYAQGAVAEKNAHVTLLFGIHPSPTYRRNVDAVLKGWEADDINLHEVSTFPIRDEDQEYYVVKADVVVSSNIWEARKRLEVLDHTDGFPTYHPHVTLAYVKRSADVDAWVDALNKAYAGADFEVKGLNYGDDD